MNQIQTRQRSVTIDRLKAIACFTVVLHHCLAQLVDKENAAFSPILCLYFFSSRIDVPLFFILSGFLLKRQPMKHFLTKRVYRILIPFAFFTSLKLVYNLQGGSFAHGDTPGSQLYHAFFMGELYWFSYPIMTMYILSPLFWKQKIVEYRGRNDELPIAAIVFFAAVILINIIVRDFRTVVIPDYFNLNKALYFFPFYLLGFVLKNTYPLFSPRKRAAEMVLAAVSVPLCFYFYIGKRGVIGYCGEILISMLLCLDIYLLVRPLKQIPRVISAVSKYTYQIYFLDSFAKVIIFFLIGKIFGAGIYQNFAACALVIVFEVSVNIGVSCFIAATAEKIPVFRFLFGLSDTK